MLSLVDGNSPTRPSQITMHTNASPASEYSRDGADGFKPLPLPSRGEDLYPGRQYYLSPIARTLIDEVFGIRGLPSIVECLHKRVPPTRMTVTSENLETGATRTQVTILDSQDATFRVQGGIGSKFTIDLAVLAERNEQYEKKTDESFFGVVQRKLAKYRDSDDKTKAKTTGSRSVGGTPAIKKYDLSILDI